MFNTMWFGFFVLKLLGTEIETKQWLNKHGLQNVELDSIEFIEFKM